MNKQEAIEQLERNVVRTSDFDRAEDVVVFEKVKSIISQIDEPQKVVVPKFVALRIEKYKNSNKSLYQLLDLSDDKEFNDWLLPNGEVDASRCDVLARAWLDGYEIERDKLYTVELSNGQPLVEVNNILYFSSDLAASNAHVSKDKLEAAGFGWVFDCNGVKVVEVE